MKKILSIVAFWAVLGGVAWASLKVWSTGENIKSADLNGNFSTLNTTKVGGGVTLTNSDVASNAAIAHSKMATPALLPKAWAIWKTACLTGTTPCSPSVGSGVTDVVWNATGDYSVRLASARPDTLYAVFATAYSASGADTVCGTYSHGTGTTLGSFGVKCYTGGAAADAAFQVMVLDNN